MILHRNSGIHTQVFTDTEANTHAHTHWCSTRSGVIAVSVVMFLSDHYLSKQPLSEDSEKYISHSRTFTRAEYRGMIAVCFAKIIIIVLFNNFI